VHQNSINIEENGLNYSLHSCLANGSALSGRR